MRSARVMSRSVLLLALPLIPLRPEGVPAQNALPRLMPESDEIRLALSAAPPEVARDADVWVLRRGGHVKVRTGTSGVACMVGRDHPESLYPICYDAEAARSILPIAIRESQLREKGADDATIEREVTGAIERGELKLPAASAMSWMLSRDQVIYAGASGRRVGQWHPHIMIYMPYATRAKLGYPARANGDLGIGDEGKATAHLIVITGAWSTEPGSG